MLIDWYNKILQQSLKKQKISVLINIRTKSYYFYTNYNNINVKNIITKK